MTIFERYGNEKLSDNTQNDYCKQCKNCAFWGNGDKFGNQYDKSCCDMFPYPANKPEEVIHNSGKCHFRLDRGKGGKNGEFTP